MMANTLTADEQRIIRSYILLPLIRMALERDRKVIGITNTKFKVQYITIIDEAIHKVTADIRRNRDELFDHHIRMTRHNWLDYEVYTRGYMFEVGYHKSIAADWIQEQIREYLKTG